MSERLLVVSATGCPRAGLPRAQTPSPTPGAAELNTSLSALVKGFLEELAGDGSEAERRRRLQNYLLARLDAQGRGVVVAERLDREAVHQRSSPSGPR